MIKKKPIEFNRIIEVTCDCCGKEMPLDLLGNLPDHVMIGGKKDGMGLDAIVCIPCMEEKMGFINIQKVDNKIGYC